MEFTIREERLTPQAYIDFLKETDLGAQYPQERFEARIATLVARASLSLVARDTQENIVGVCFGITDFAYWLFITDLGVVRRCVGQGIGSALVKKLHQLAGGTKEIMMYTCAHTSAIPFYEKLGMEASKNVLVYDDVDWTHFTVE